jgi:hypothetical protein
MNRKHYLPPALMLVPTALFSATLVAVLLTIVLNLSSAGLQNILTPIAAI